MYKRLSIVLLSALILTGCEDKAAGGKKTEAEEQDTIVIEVETEEGDDIPERPVSGAPGTEPVVITSASEEADSGEVSRSDVPEAEKSGESDVAGSEPSGAGEEKEPESPEEAEETEDAEEAATEDVPAAEVPHTDGGKISLDPSWEFADFSKINSGCAFYYAADEPRKGITVGVNAGHGTSGGAKVKTYCHPDKSPKTTGGSTSAGAIEAAAVSGGMTFNDGTPEAVVTLEMAKALKDVLLSEGYDVLMIRESSDVQLDNIARTVICNNNADCHIAIHWDGDGLDYDKGCFYMSVPDGIKGMYPVSGIWKEHERLGRDLMDGLSEAGFKLHNSGSMSIDLTQTSFSTIPSVDIELGNQAGRHDEEYLNDLAKALLTGIDEFFR
ncbi:MAG: N-acetylmuramoyl-L-alanine amidase [Lachnospiraceae bacterium]|nr:N-acetylmuramoyl-L-alanine amidase [Lachnospiraceae bacterium]